MVGEDGGLSFWVTRDASCLGTGGLLPPAEGQCRPVAGGAVSYIEVNRRAFAVHGQDTGAGAGRRPRAAVRNGAFAGAVGLGAPAARALPTRQSGPKWAARGAGANARGPADAAKPDGSAPNLGTRRAGCTVVQVSTTARVTRRRTSAHGVLECRAAVSSRSARVR